MCRIAYRRELVGGPRVGKFRDWALFEDAFPSHNLWIRVGGKEVGDAARCGHSFVLGRAPKELEL